MGRRVCGLVSAMFADFLNPPPTQNQNKKSHVLFEGGPVLDSIPVLSDADNAGQAGDANKQVVERKEGEENEGKRWAKRTTNGRGNEEK